MLRNRDESPPDPEELGLEEELPGWHGYVEWEKYPERKQMVKEYMKKFAFPGVSLLFSFSFVVDFFPFSLCLWSPKFQILKYQKAEFLTGGSHIEMDGEGTD